MQEELGVKTMLFLCKTRSTPPLNVHKSLFFIFPCYLLPFNSQEAEHSSIILCVEFRNCMDLKPQGRDYLVLIKPNMYIWSALFTWIAQFAFSIDCKKYSIHEFINSVWGTDVSGALWVEVHQGLLQEQTSASKWGLIKLGCGLQEQKYVEKKQLTCLTAERGVTLRGAAADVVAL